MKKWCWEAKDGTKGIAQEESAGLFGFKIGIYTEGGFLGLGSTKIGEVEEVKEEKLREFLEKKYGKPVKIWTEWISLRLFLDNRKLFNIFKIFKNLIYW